MESIGRMIKVAHRWNATEARPGCKEWRWGQVCKAHVDALHKRRIYRHVISGIWDILRIRVMVWWSLQLKLTAL